MKKIYIDGKPYMQNVETKKLYGMPRIIFTRSIARNAAKKSQGSNRIRSKWRNFQIEKYGISKWCRMYNKSNCNSKTNYLTPEDAQKI